MNNISLIFQRQSRVDLAGYNDLFMAMKGDHLIAAGPCRTGPNYRQPRSKGGGNWELSYGLLAPGHYTYTCMDHHKFAKCLLINDGGRCPSVVPNPNHDGEKWLSGLFVHHGVDDKWAGSAGCQTLAPDWFGVFIKMFEPGDRGCLELIDRYDSHMV